jgi:hypothetical protein
MTDQPELKKVLSDEEITEACRQVITNAPDGATQEDAEDVIRQLNEYKLHGIFYSLWAQGRTEVLCRDTGKAAFIPAAADDTWRHAAEWATEDTGDNEDAS